ncbi:AsmA family protein [candidate division KSB1 bacterium]|nr:AsmA family protein [candidate division KSB1 bacterium]
MKISLKPLLKNKIFKKFIKIFLWFLGIIAGLTLILYLVLSFFFPNDLVRKYAIAEISSALNRKIDIQSARINLFKGIALENLVLYESDSLKAPDAEISPPFVSIDEIILKYRFWPLLKKQIKIHEVRIDSPTVFLSQNPDGKWNFDDLITPADTTFQPEPVDTTALLMPVRIELKKFNLNNLAVILNQKQDSSELRLNFASLSGKISELEVPRGDQNRLLEALKINLELLMQRAQLSLTYFTLADSETYHFGADVDLELLIDLAGIEKFSGYGMLNCTNWYLYNNGKKPDSLFSQKFSHLIGLDFETVGNLKTGDLSFPKLLLILSEQTILSGEGTVSQMFDSLLVDFHIKESNLNLSHLSQQLSEIKIADLQKISRMLKIDGSLSLDGTELSGHPTAANPRDGLKIKTVLNLNNLSLDYEEKVAQISDLNLNLNLAGTYYQAGLSDFDLKGSLFIPAFRSAPSDTSQISARNIELKLDSKLAADFFPQYVDLDLKISDILKSQVDLRFQFRSAGNWQNIFAKSRLDVTGLQLQSLDTEELAGTSNLSLELEATSLEQIQCELTATLDSLFLFYENNWLDLPSQQLSSALTVQVDSSFEHIQISPFSINLKNLIEMHGVANLVDFGETAFNLKINDATLRLGNIYRQIPDIFKVDIGELYLYGAGKATADFHGKLPANGLPDYRGQIHLELTPLEIDYVEMFMAFKKMKVISEIQVYPDSLEATLTAHADSFYMGDLRRKPFHDVDINAEISMPFFQQVNIKSSSVHIHEINTLINATGQIDSLDTETIIRLLVHLKFDNQQPVEPYEFVRLNGKFEADANLYIDLTSLAYNAEIDFQGLNMFYEDYMTVQGIRGKMPLHQRINLLKLHFIDESALQLASSSLTDVEYHYLRPYLIQLQPGISIVNIDKVVMMDYELTNLKMDVVVEGPQVRIPRFSMQAYEGNILGNFELDLGEGTFEIPDTMLNYASLQMKATLSSINTAKLNPVISAKAQKSKINANLSLKSEGLNPVPGGKMVLTGYFHITEIGPKVADNLLRSLDPSGADQGIQSVRKMLKSGFKSKLMSFDIKHGHFYPYIVLTKPFYIPVNVAGGQVALPRIPVELFLKQAAMPYYQE